VSAEIDQPQVTDKIELDKELSWSAKKFWCVLDEWQRVPCWL